MMMPHLMHPKAAHMAPMFGPRLNPLAAGMHRMGMSNPLTMRQHFAPGGMPALPQANPVNRAMAVAARPVQARSANGDPIHTGPLRGPVAGRTDHLAITVPEGSFVIPADVVNHFGEDNTEAGHRVLEALFKGSVIKNMRQQPGGAGLNKSHVPIAAAGGEYVVPPETVAHIGNGDLKRGHAILDKFVLQARADHIKTLKKLPGPAGANDKGTEKKAA